MGCVVLDPIFLFNGEGSLAYAGQFDATRPSTGEKASGADLRDAVGKPFAKSSCAKM
jgi:hypothetical protein